MATVYYGDGLSQSRCTQHTRDPRCRAERSDAAAAMGDARCAAATVATPLEPAQSWWHNGSSCRTPRCQRAGRRRSGSATVPFAMAASICLSDTVQLCVCVRGTTQLPFYRKDWKFGYAIKYHTTMMLSGRRHPARSSEVEFIASLFAI